MTLRIHSRRTSPVRSRLNRTLLLAIVPIALGCSAAPNGEVTASTHSALTPNEAPAPTTYTISLSYVYVVTGQEPPLSVPRTQAAPIWTPDRGFNDWAEVAVSVEQGASISSACNLGPGGNLETLGNCVGGGFNNGAFTVGQPLTVPFQTNLATDTVNVELVMDNVEQGFPMTAQNLPEVPPISVGVVNGLQASGSIVGTIGAFAGVGNAYAGAIIASIGATLSVIGNVLGSEPTPQGPLATPVTCAGGLLGEGNLNTSADSIYLSFTGAELAQLTDTASGSNTLSLNPSSTWGHGCASSLNIVLTIARSWADGVGPSPKSADQAVALTMTENDVFSANASTSSIDRVFNPGYGTGWQDTHVGSVVGTPPVAALSINPNDLQLFWVDGSGSIWGANGTGLSPTVTNLRNALVAGSAPPAYANVTATERFPGCYDYAWIGTSGAVYDVTAGCQAQSLWALGADGIVTANGLAPAGAPIAMVGRTFLDVDHVFVGMDGQLRATSSGNGGGTWATTLIPGGAVATAGAHIAMASPMTQALDAFYIGTNGALYQASWTPLWGWTNVAISNPGVASAGAPISVVSRTPKSLDVAFIGAGYNVVWGNSTDPSSAWTDGGKTSGATWTFTTLPWVTSAAGPISIVSGTNNNLDVFYRSVAGQQYTGHWNEGNDTWTMTQVIASGPPAPGCTFDGLPTDATHGFLNVECPAPVGADGTFIFQQTASGWQTYTAVPNQPAYSNLQLSIPYTSGASLTLLSCSVNPTWGLSNGADIAPIGPGAVGCDATATTVTIPHEVVGGSGGGGSCAPVACAGGYTWNASLCQCVRTSSTCTTEACICKSEGSGCRWTGTLCQCQ